MKRLVPVLIAGLAFSGCDLAGGDENDDPLLEVTARSATTLTLRWPSMGGGDVYTVDYLTGIAKCRPFPPEHPNILVVTGTAVKLTALQPSTRYHIHVHLLPHGQDGLTTIAFVSTLPVGSAEQSVTAADYESCSTKN